VLDVVELLEDVELVEELVEDVVLDVLVDELVVLELNCVKSLFHTAVLPLVDVWIYILLSPECQTTSPLAHSTESISFEEIP
jgi:hypothetical protein